MNGLSVRLRWKSRKREWVGLTKEEMREICTLVYACSKHNNPPVLNVLDYAKAIEAKLKEKNT
jgi:hypothetical protein